MEGSSCQSCMCVSSAPGAPRPQARPPPSGSRPPEEDLWPSPWPRRLEPWLILHRNASASSEKSDHCAPHVRGPTPARTHASIPQQPSLSPAAPVPAASLFPAFRAASRGLPDRYTLESFRAASPDRLCAPGTSPSPRLKHQHPTTPGLTLPPPRP